QTVEDGGPSLELLQLGLSRLGIRQGRLRALRQVANVRLRYSALQHFRESLGRSADSIFSVLPERVIEERPFSSSVILPLRRVCASLRDALRIRLCQNGHARGLPLRVLVARFTSNAVRDVA